MSFRAPNTSKTNLSLALSSSFIKSSEGLRDLKNSMAEMSALLFIYVFIKK